MSRAAKILRKIEEGNRQTKLPSSVHPGSYFIEVEDQPNGDSMIIIDDGREAGITMYLTKENVRKLVSMLQG